VGVNEFDFQEKEEEKLEIRTTIEVKKAELKRITNLLKLKDSPDIVKFLENFLLHEYGVVGKAGDREFDTNKNFHYKGRQFQLRKIIHWQASLESDIRKVKSEVTKLERRLEGTRPDDEPEA